MNYTPNAIERAEARRERNVWLHHKPARGWQMGLAFVDAAIAKPAHPLSTQIGRVARSIDSYGA